MGTLIEICGGYAVYLNENTYSAPGWNGTIKVGTEKNDTLTGTNGPDLLLGLGGNDLINGQGGDDLLCGGDGVDLLQGFAGNDLLDGGNGNDVLNGGPGDYDVLAGAEGNDVLLDGDGVIAATGGGGIDSFTLALRNGWRDERGQPAFTGIAAGYENDSIGVTILDPAPFFIALTGDEHDNPASQREGNNDMLTLAGNIDPTSLILKVESQQVISANAALAIPSAEAGAEYLAEAVGETLIDPDEQVNRLYLPLITR